jgi:hypothetical protein
MNGCHIKPEQFFNLIFGYYDRWAETLTYTKVGDGTYYMSFTAVPAGEVWVLLGLSWTNRARVIRCSPRLIFPSLASSYLKDGNTPGAWAWDVWNGLAVLTASDTVGIVFYNCLNGDTVEGQVYGYKMKLSQ